MYLLYMHVQFLWMYSVICTLVLKHNVGGLVRRMGNWFLGDKISFISAVHHPSSLSTMYVAKFMCGFSYGVELRLCQS